MALGGIQALPAPSLHRRNFSLTPLHNNHKNTNPALFCCLKAFMDQCRSLPCSPRMPHYMTNELCHTAWCVWCHQSQYANQSWGGGHNPSLSSELQHQWKKKTNNEGKIEISDTKTTEGVCYWNISLKETRKSIWQTKGDFPKEMIRLKKELKSNKYLGKFNWIYTI